MSNAPAPLLCPYCADHPALSSDQAALTAVHCGSCAASVLPSQSVVQLVTGGLNLALDAFTGQVNSAKPGPIACPACQGPTRLVNLRLRPVHVCPACGVTAFPGGTLYALTQGKFGALKKVEPPPAQDVPAEEEAGPGFVSRLITALAYSGNARKYTYVALSMVMFTVIFAISMTQRKPIKMGKDGLPTGNLGMRPESAEAFRNAVNPAYLAPAEDHGDCPDGAKPVRGAHGEHCELNGVKHGPEEQDTCDEEGRGSSIQGNWKHGKRHGRFVERNCEGEVVGDYSYQDGDLTR